MKKYIIAIYSLHTGENRIFLISATDNVEAAKYALIQNVPSIYRHEDYISDVRALGPSFEELRDQIKEWDLVISIPFNITPTNAK